VQTSCIESHQNLLHQLIYEVQENRRTLQHNQNVCFCSLFCVFKEGRSEWKGPHRNGVDDDDGDGDNNSLNHSVKKRDDESTFFFSSKPLKPCDLRELVERKQSEHFRGSREWLFEEVREWVLGEREGADSGGGAGTKRVFWLVGGAGTGKSVVSAQLLKTAGIREHIKALLSPRRRRGQ